MYYSIPYPLLSRLFTMFRVNASPSADGEAFAAKEKLEEMLAKAKAAKEAAEK